MQGPITKPAGKLERDALIITSTAAKKASKPSDVYPGSFVAYLRAACPRFSALPRQYQHPLAINLWAATGARLAHSHHEGAFTMHWRARQSMYGTARAFHECNRAVQWFELVEGASIVDNIAQAWKLTERADTLVQGYFELAHTARSAWGAGLVAADGKPYRIPADAIRARTHDGGNTKHPRRAIRAAVELNGEALHAFHAVGEAWLQGEPCPPGFAWAFAAWDAIRDSRGPNGGEARARQRVNDSLVQASALLHLAKSSSAPGYVLPVTYQEYPTGRLFAEGAHNLQTCRREVRRAALLGYWDVDISNCHWALIEQMAARIGLQAPAIRHYLANKKKTRAAIALAGGISEADAKQVLIGLVYGMNLHATEADRRQAIIELVGAAAAARLRECPELLALHGEVKGLRRAILADYAERTGRKHCIVNDAGNAISIKASAAEQLAHVLQGAEAAILRTVIADHGHDLRLLAHDGWVMATEPDRAAIEARIMQATGYHVELEISAL